MFFCNNCGAQLKDGTDVCPQCGTRVGQSGSERSGFSMDPGTAESSSKSLFDFQPESSAQKRGYAAQDNSINERTKAVASQFRNAAKSTGTAVVSAAGVASDAVKTNIEQRRATEEQNRKSKIIFAEGETVIRSYNVTKKGTQNSPGRLTVTNKRLIFTAVDRKSKAFMSTPIDTVGSIDIITGKDLLMTLLGILFCLTIILLIPGIILLAKNKGSMFISISSINSSPGMVIGQVDTHGKARNAIVGQPGSDVNELMSELGAMILDLQQFGDNAIEKWKR